MGGRCRKLALFWVLGAAAHLTSGLHIRTGQPAASQQATPKDADLRTITLNVDWWAFDSIADGAKRFVANFDAWLDEPIYGGWNITLVFDTPVRWINTLESELIEWSPDNKTLVFGPLWWDKDLEAGHQTQHWQGIVDSLPMTISSSTLTYDRSITTPSDIKTIPPHMEPYPIDIPEAVPGEKFNLAKSLALSIWFYEVQRSGVMPANKRVNWRFDSELDDRGEDGEDLTGGWHDAGDHIKFGLPMAYSVTILTYGMLLFPEAYKETGQWSWGLEQVKWALDWLIKAHVAPDEMYVQVSDKPTDHYVWTRPEDMTAKRRAYKVTCANPGSAPVMEAAAAMAASSILFATPEAKALYGDYSTLLLLHARQLFDFAAQCPGDYVVDGRVAADCCYGAPGYHDEEQWAAAWLYAATNEPRYLRKAEEYVAAGGAYSSTDFLDWHEKRPITSMLLYNLTGDATYRDALVSYLDGWVQSTKVPRTPKGLSYISNYGSNRVASNQAFLALAAAESGLSPDEYRAYAKSQVYYILGDCCRNDTGDVSYSYQIGMADRYPRNPHHRATSCDLNGNCECADHHKPSYHILFGAVVGGPRNDDTYIDKCPDFVYNEVTTDYNAGFQGAVAGLKALSLRGQLGDQ